MISQTRQNIVEKQEISRAARAEEKLPVVGSRLAQTSRFDPFCAQPPISLDGAKKEEKRRRKRYVGESNLWRAR